MVYIDALVYIGKIGVLISTMTFSLLRLLFENLNKHTPTFPKPPPFANSVANLIQINGFLRHSKSMHFESHLRQEVKFIQGTLNSF